MSERERLLLGIGLPCALVVVVDVIILKIVGEVSSGWWWLAVPIGLFFVGGVAIGCLLLFLLERRRRA